MWLNESFNCINFDMKLKSISVNWLIGTDGIFHLYFKQLKTSKTQSNVTLILISKEFRVTYHQHKVIILYIGWSRMSCDLWFVMKSVNLRFFGGEVFAKNFLLIK